MLPVFLFSNLALLRSALTCTYTRKPLKRKESFTSNFHMNLNFYLYKVFSISKYLKNCPEKYILPMSARNENLYLFLGLVRKMLGHVDI
ncbi:hypothetical protein [Methanosarcina sp.]|uniref:hypothetical protein n=1 Tax=Methanosarcina sp. TaxID=2213 RepID=UPI003C71D1C6